MRREARGCDIGGSGRANAAILAEGRDWGLGIGDWGFGIGEWGFECGSGFSRELCLGPSPCESRGGSEGVPTARTDPKRNPPQPVRPASTADLRSLARESLITKRPAYHPAFAGA